MADWKDSPFRRSRCWWGRIRCATHKMNKVLRTIGYAGYGCIARLEGIFDRLFFADDVPLSNSISHLKWREYLYDIGNKPGMRILEIGSREVTGPSTDRANFEKACYVGFDIYPGTNVDVVGDVHRLSSYFAPDERF